MLCHFRDGEGNVHDILIESEITVSDVKKTIEKIMMNDYLDHIYKEKESQIKDTNNSNYISHDVETQCSSQIENNNANFPNQNKSANGNKNKSKSKSRLHENTKETLTNIKTNNDNSLNQQGSERSLSLFKYRRDLFKIQYKMYTLYNDQKLYEFNIQEGDLFIITPLPTIKIYFMLPINSTRYFNCIFKPMFLQYEQQSTNNENNNTNNCKINQDDNNDNNNINMNQIKDNEHLKVPANWYKKNGWTIGPIAIPFSSDCAVTLLNALEAVFNVKQTNIKIFDSSWNEIRTLTSINPIIKENLIFGLYIRNKIEETLNHPNKNLIAWTNVFKYKYYNLPTKSKSRQLARSQSNSKLQVLIAQPIPQEIPKANFNSNNTDNSIPLAKSKSGPIHNSQLPLQKTSSITFANNNELSTFTSKSRCNNTNPINNIRFYHPIPIFLSNNEKQKVLAVFNSDENINIQLQAIKKDLGIPESIKISIEFNNKLLDLNRNPEQLKIIEFSIVKIVSPSSCILI